MSRLRLQRGRIAADEVVVFGFSGLGLVRFRWQSAPRFRLLGRRCEFVTPSVVVVHRPVDNGRVGELKAATLTPCRRT